MSKHLVRDLENLQRQILAMAGVVEDVIYKSILAFQERDKNLAQEVIATDSRMDESTIGSSKNVSKFLPCMSRWPKICGGLPP